MKTRSVILAAGKGTRMQSDLPKVLHPLNNIPMITFSVQAARQATGQKPVLVIGHGAEQVRQTVGNQAEYVIQEEQLGTGHAVSMAASLLRGSSDCVLVTSGDMPLLSISTLQELIDCQTDHDGPISLLTLIAPNPRGFGRIVRNDQDQVVAIVEEAVASPEQLAIPELNVGAYCFSADWLWDNLGRIPISPKGEYYLTDMVGIAVESGLSVRPIVVEKAEEALGINTREHLEEAEAIVRRPDFGRV